MPENLVGKILHAGWGSTMRLNTFCPVVDETPKSYLLLELKKTSDPPKGQEGTNMPVVRTLESLTDADRKKAFRVMKPKKKSSYVCSKEFQSFKVWDGKAKEFYGD